MHVYNYRIAGKFGEFGKSSVIRPRFAKLKPSKLVLIINNLLDDLLIRQTFFCQMLKMSQFTKFPPAKLSRYTVLHIQLLAHLVYIHMLMTIYSVKIINMGVICSKQLWVYNHYYMICSCVFSL